MKDLQPLKPIAEQLLALSTELLRVIDTDEQDYKRLIENVKKTPAVRCLPFRAQRRKKTTTLLCKNRQSD